ncbi:cytidine deaminase [Dickeya poaceiphila]|uniref:Cytidine deaminase n=1 Tax=Dickeya poaceiphila TaxID=568768 RepID=A0A5B8I7W5_9GAMM|nr:cytidine deaminase [Dickeya poaceiphila]QDX30413.1 cytidine deaminase [Dickeya poaceiphila]
MQARFHDAFTQLPSALQTALAPILVRDDFAAMLTADEVSQICAQCRLDADALAFALLPLAAACALTPVSGFHVGAIAQGTSGAFYWGANMEFDGLPLQQTVHAEQSAICHAWLRDEPALRAVTVNYTPCGHCRQFMNELNSAAELRICLPGRSPALLGHYLPDAFGPRDLAINTLLMDNMDNGLTLTTDDTLLQLALAAANRSHAPYSKAFSGIALETRQGRRYTGRYAENAAFNPSLPPMQAALNLVNLAGERFADIQRAVLVESSHATLSQWSQTQPLLASLGCADLQRELAH